MPSNAEPDTAAPTGWRARRSSECGERLIPEEGSAELVLEHMARYQFAARLVDGRNVLDLGCGVGYGSSLIAAGNRHRVIGLDRSLDATAEAYTRHGSEGPCFLAGDAQALPFSSESFDCVVALEVIEHVEDWTALLQEVERVLGPDGAFVLSTPNRMTYAEARNEPNPFHVHEFDREELREALRSLFPMVEFYGEVIAEGAFIWALTNEAVPPVRRPELSWLNHDHRLNDEPDFFLVVCRKKQPRVRLFRKDSAEPRELFCIGDTTELRRLRNTLWDTFRDLDEKRAWATRLDQEITEYRSLIQSLQSDLESKIRWARELEAEVRERRERILQLQEEVEERTRWAQELEAELRQREG